MWAVASPKRRQVGSAPRPSAYGNLDGKLCPTSAPVDCRCIVADGRPQHYVRSSLVASPTFTEDVEFHELGVEGLHVQYHKLSSLAKFRHSNKTDSLAQWTHDDPSLELGLIADEEDMRTGRHHESVCILVGVTPY